MRRDIAFVHIPKTAGTSLRNALENAFSDHLILRDYGNDPFTTPRLHEVVHVQKRPSQLREAFRSGRRGILLSGHFPARRYWEVFHAESFVTFVRDPVDRVISEYNHFVSYEGWTRPLEEFAATPRFRNVMSTFLSGVDLDRFGFIGVTENLDAVLPALGAHLGVDLALAHENAGQYANGLVPTVAQRAMIAELNLDDVDLYRRLRQARGDAPRAAGADSTVEHGYLGRVTLRQTGELTGWLCNTAREMIAEVDILDEEQQSLASVPADLYHEAPKKRGYSRSGFCGFRFDLRSLASNARQAGTSRSVRVTAKNSGYELAGSPLTWQ
jgi:hypothetical protein